MGGVLRGAAVAIWIFDYSGIADEGIRLPAISPSFYT